MLVHLNSSVKQLPKQSYSTNCQYVNLDKKHGEVPNLFNGTVRFTELDPHGYCHIRLPKLGKVKVYLFKELPKCKEVRIARVTVSVYSSEEYYVSMMIKSDEPLAEIYPKTGSAVGYDLNVKNFLMDTTKHEEPNPKFYKRLKDKLAREQRILSRRYRRAKKTKHNLAKCKNYQKQKLKVARLHRRIFRQRHAFLDELSTAYIKNHDLVVGENLKSKNLLKNHALAMSIGGKLTLEDREWGCPNCHSHHIRDYNAAKNILAKGYQVLKIPEYKYKFS